MRAGQQFLFKLLLDQTQNGYKGPGLISYQFHKVGSTLPQDYSKYDQLDSSGSAPLHDGQVNPLSLLISDEMSPGTWKLTDVTIVEQNDRLPVSILGNVTFEILPSPPMVIHIHAPGSVKPGQRFSFNITIDEYPKGLPKGCGLMLSGVLHSAELKGQPDLNAYQVPLNDIVLTPDQLSYDMSGLFDPDLPSGPWQGDVHIGLYLPQPTSIGAAERYSILLPQCRHIISLHEVEEKFSFTLEASELLTPNSATVIVNPSQRELLRAKADILRAKVQRLKQQLSSENTTTNQVLLRNSVQEELKDLDKTEATYKEKEDKGSPPSYTKAANTFFDDIRLSYNEALKALTTDSAQVRESGPRLVLVSTILASSAPRLSHASEVVLACFMYTANVFNLAASVGTMTRDLEVHSIPQGATVTYWQKLDPEPKILDEVTNTTIRDLYRARYTIRFKKPGYKETVIQFNADSTEQRITAYLERKGRAR